MCSARSRARITPRALPIRMAKRATRTVAELPAHQGARGEGDERARQEEVALLTETVEQGAPAPMTTESGGDTGDRAVKRRKAGATRSRKRDAEPGAGNG